MARTTTTNQVTAAIIRYLNLKVGYSWRNNSVGVWDPQKKIYRKNRGFGFIKGTSDILGIEKDTGRFIAVEVKIGRDKLSPQQKTFLENIQKMGGHAIVARSLDDVIKYFDEQQS